MLDGPLQCNKAIIPEEIGLLLTKTRQNLYLSGRGILESALRIYGEDCFSINGLLKNQYKIKKENKKMKKLVLIALLLVSFNIKAEENKSKITKDVFFVYKDRGSKENHAVGSGWMGNNPATLGKVLKFNPGYVVDQGKGDYCIKITYANMDPEQSWCGIYFQVPANNWGDKKGGYDLTGMKKLTFKARGEKGGEMVDFFVGGIKGSTELGDSDEARLDGTELTKEWKIYTIDLQGLDMSHIIGPFGWASNLDVNPDGVVFYLDEIKFSK